MKKVWKLYGFENILNGGFAMDKSGNEVSCRFKYLETYNRDLWSWKLENIEFKMQRRILISECGRTIQWRDYKLIEYPGWLFLAYRWNQIRRQSWLETNVRDLII